MGATMSFEAVISSFRAFVRSFYPRAKPEGPEVPFPFRLEAVRAAIEHHLVPLIIVARSDRELLTSERDVIVDHCRLILRQHRDRLLSAAEIAELEEYVERFSPNLSQLDAALHKFETEGRDEFANLLATADRVITADDIVREEERKQLAEIKKQFEQVAAKG